MKEQEEAIITAYEDDRKVHREEFTLWIGIAIMIGVIILDLLLFQWIGKSL